MKGCPNWLLHYSLFILLSSLSPLGISQMSFTWDLPLGCERPLFLNDRRWLGCGAPNGQLTRPEGSPSRSVGVTQTGHSLPRGRDRENILLNDPGRGGVLEGLQEVVQGLHGQVRVCHWLFCLRHVQVSYFEEDFFFWRKPSTISTFLKLGHLLVVDTAR